MKLKKYILIHLIFGGGGLLLVLPIIGQPKNQKTIRVAAAQVSSYFLDQQKTLHKACQTIHEAAGHGAQLVVFPEAFIPSYPAWVWHISPAEWKQNTELYQKMMDQAVAIPGPVTDSLCQAARLAHINVVIGVNEINTETSSASLYNTIIYISDQGKLLGKHRKLVPTSGERLVWARGDGSTFDAYDTSVGRIAGLICWENIMPLARTAVYKLGTQILVSPTVDDSESWITSMQAAAREGGLFVITACSPENQDWIPDEYDFKKLMPDKSEWPKKGNSCIIGPYGNIMAGPLTAQEGVIYADINLEDIFAAKRTFDAVGNYARPDVFKLSIDKGKANMREK